jgi:hypothetical protein
MSRIELDETWMANIVEGCEHLSSASSSVWHRILSGQELASCFFWCCSPASATCSLEPSHRSMLAGLVGAGDVKLNLLSMSHAGCSTSTSVHVPAHGRHISLFIGIALDQDSNGSLQHLTLMTETTWENKSNETLTCKSICDNNGAAE